MRQAEHDILQAKQRLVELRRKLPPQPFPDYAFRTWDGSTVHLSDLFGDKKDLILVHNMGKACNYCTMWADGLNGVLDRLESRAAFVVFSPDEPEVQQRFAQERGWDFRMVSPGDPSFNREAGFEQDGEPMPGVSVFYREGDQVLRVSETEFGPGDDFCAVWHLFDLLRDGPDGWEPSNDTRQASPACCGS